MNVSLPGSEPSPSSASPGGKERLRSLGAHGGAAIRVRFGEEGTTEPGAAGAVRVVRLGSGDAREGRQLLRELCERTPDIAETRVFVDGPLATDYRVTEVALYLGPRDAGPAPEAAPEAGISADLDVPAPPGAWVTAARWTADGGGVPDASAPVLLDGLRRVISHPTIAAVPLDRERVRFTAPIVHPIRADDGRSFALSVAALPRWAAASPARAAELAVLEACRHLVVGGFRPTALAAEIDGDWTDSYHDLATRQSLAVSAERLSLPMSGVRSAGAGGTSRRNWPLAPLVVAVGEAVDGRPPPSPWCGEPGQALVLAGPPGSAIESSLHLELAFRQRAGAVPLADPVAEEQLWRFLEQVQAAGVVRAARPVGAGGLLAAVVTALVARGTDGGGEPRAPLGASLETTPLRRGRRDAILLGEQPGRVLLAVDPDDLPAVAAASEVTGVSAIDLGRTTGDQALLVRRGMTAVAWRVTELADRWRDAWSPPPPRPGASPRLP